MDAVHLRARSGRRADRGFTLAEVLLVTVLVGVGIAGVSWLMTMAAMTQDVHASVDPESLLLAREIREMAATLPTAPSGMGAADSADEITSLESLDGATFSPPLRADGQTLSNMSGWSQSIDVSLRDLDDTNTVLSDTVRIVPKGERCVWRLDVTIAKSGTLVGNHTWWIAPQ